MVHLDKIFGEAGLVAGRGVRAVYIYVPCLPNVPRQQERKTWPSGA